MRKFIGLIAVGAIILGVTFGFNSASAKVSEEFFIDPSIKGNERKVIEDVMKALPKEDRVNVIHIDKYGKIYSNRPELKKEVFEYRNLGNNIFVNDRGEELTFPEENRTLNSETDSVSALSTYSTGPFRRVFTKKGTSAVPYAWQSNYVYLPGSPAIGYGPEANKSGDTGYAYIGGVGSTGIHVDGGLQHSPTYDDWSIFLKVQGTDAVSLTPRFKSGQNVFVKFYVSRENEVAVSVNGVATDGVKREITINRAASGWKLNGIGNQLKRTTSIAQKNLLQNFNSGSWNTGVRWYSSYLGLSSISNRLWSASDVEFYENHPTNSPKVSVSWVSANEETVNIDLRK